MIFSRLKMFADKQEITLANNTNQNSVALTDVIDLGVSQKPYRVKRALKRNIGGGDPIPLMATIDSMDAGITATFGFALQTSPDNATWRTLFESSDFTGVGYKLSVNETPQGTDRYLRMIFKYKYTSAAANKKVKVTSAIGTFQPTNLHGL